MCFVDVCGGGGMLMLSDQEKEREHVLNNLWMNMCVVNLS